MSRKSICIYDDNYIGVEKIYTLCEGRPIYIEGEVERVRELGRQKKLFCHCGCGANVMLVAGKAMKRAPHFRVWCGTNVEGCSAIDESDNSIWSKVILKLWMEEKLNTKNIDRKVALNRIASFDRKFEFTFYDFDNQVGLCYWNKSNNITSDKVCAVENCEAIRKVVYITDISNAGTDGQYQEFINKIQSVQGYNLFLNLDTCDMQNVLYEKATLDVRVFVKTYIGFWKELRVLSDSLSTYSFSPEMELLHNGKSIRDMVAQEIEMFKKKNAEQEENERIRQEELKSESERLAREKAEKICLTREQGDARESKLRKIEMDYVYKKDFTKDGEKIADIDFATYGKPVINQLGHRFKKCKICRRHSIESYFVDVDEKSDSNFGICKDCQKGSNSVIMGKSEKSMKCPRCGGELKIVLTGLGERLRCENYPICKYMETV